MKRRILVFLLTSVVLISASAGCTPKEDIRFEVIDCLIQLNVDGNARIASELDRIYEQIYEIDESLLALEQVLTPALDWIEYQESRVSEDPSVSHWDSWSARVKQSSLAEFKNDRYKVTELTFAASNVGLPTEEFSSTIKVFDLNTKTRSDWEAIDADLKERKAMLEQLWQTKLEQLDMSESALESGLQHYEVWSVDKIGENTYRISGHGLGWEEEVTTGEWTYHRDTGEIEPADTQSTALKEVISAKF